MPIATKPKRATTTTKPTATVRTQFHLDLSDAIQGEDHWLVALGKKCPIVPHTSETREAVMSAWPHLRSHGANLTHYTRDPIELPADCAVRVHVKRSMKTTPGRENQVAVTHAAMHIPPSADQLKSTAAAPIQNVAVVSNVETARTILFHHPDLMTNDTDASGIIYDHMEHNPVVSDKINQIAIKMRQMGPPAPASGWAHLDAYTPPQCKWFDGTQTVNLIHITDELKAAAGPAMTALLKAVKNDNRLKNVKWTLKEGASVQPNTPAQLQKAATRLRAGEGDKWQPVLTTDSVDGFGAEIAVLDATRKQIKLSLTNTYMRYLGAYIRFYDAAMNPMNVPTWEPDDAGVVTDLVADLNIQYDDIRFLGYLSPVNDVMAIPITADPGEASATITFPTGAVSASIYGSGLGTGADLWPKTPLIGGLLTGLCNFAIPTYLLAFGAAKQASKPLYDAVEKITTNKAFRIAMASALAAYFGYEIGAPAAQEHKFNWGAIVDLFKMMFEKGAEELLLYVEATTAAEEAAEEVPFAGWIVLAVDIAVGAAQIAETIVEVASSAWNIENKISTSITTAVTLHPDPRHGAFPQAQATDKVHYVVTMTYQDQNRPARSDPHDIAGIPSGLLAASFPDNTLGGLVKFEANYYINDWLAAKATTGWKKNDDSTVAQVDLYLIQFPVPLDEKSIYAHSAVLTYQNGAYVWQQTPNAPTTTISNTDTSPTGNAISKWTGLTLSQRSGMLGMAWKAAGTGISSCSTGGGSNSQYFAMQNMSIPGEAMSAVKFPSCGLEDSTLLVYDPYPPKFQMDNDGQWVIGSNGKPVADPTDTQLGNYWVDPRKSANPQEQDGGYHLRKVVLDETTPFNMGTNLLSCGRFPYQPDSIALHPSGHVIAVNQQYKKLQIGLLKPDGVNDSDLPLARAYAGEAQVVDRPGLLFHPVAVTCSYDGTILVLEDTKSSTSTTEVVLARVQAFDLQGKPVNRFFDASGQPSSFLTLSTSGDNTYLDIAAVGDQKMTYIYVLYYTGDGSVASDYHMSIYQYGNTPPSKNPLVTTDNLAAAKIAVDMWHTAYVLNFEMVTDGKGNPAGPQTGSTGPKGRTVPSISEWVPPTT